jgi:hypothetical protein
MSIIQSSVSSGSQSPIANDNFNPFTLAKILYLINERKELNEKRDGNK